MRAGMTPLVGRILVRAWLLIRLQEQSRHLRHLLSFPN